MQVQAEEWASLLALLATDARASVRLQEAEALALLEVAAGAVPSSGTSEAAGCAMTEYPVLYCPPGQESTALGQIFGGVAGAIEETDARIVIWFPSVDEQSPMDAAFQVLFALENSFLDAEKQLDSGISTPLDDAMCADLVPGIWNTARELCKLAGEIESERGRFETFLYGEGRDYGSPTNYVGLVLKMRGLVSAIAALVNVFGDGLESEALRRDRATAALWVNAAFVDGRGRVIARTGAGNTAEK